MKDIYIPQEFADDLTQLTKAYLDPATGHEINNPKPLVDHMDLGQPITLEERIERIMRTSRLRRALSEQGQETFDESNDFDVPEDNIHFTDDTQYTLMDDEFPTDIPNGDPTPSPPVENAQEPKGDPPQSPAGSPPLTPEDQLPLPGVKE